MWNLNGRKILKCPHCGMKISQCGNIWILLLQYFFLKKIREIIFSDVRFILHHCMSKSMENFYQESGRAGRDSQMAKCILLYKFSDISRLSTMVFTEQTGLEKLYGIVSYCLNNSRWALYTVWKFQDFCIAEILREITFEHSRSA